MVLGKVNVNAICNFFSNATKVASHIVAGASRMGRVVEGPVQRLLGTREHWASIFRVVADRDDEVE